jgi:3-phenylpropionate/cinnamic acid dioxygenase small subunit
VTSTGSEVADRLAIQDVIVRYAWAIDTRDWALLASLFTPDAEVDYSSNPQGPAGKFIDVLPWLQDSLAAFVSCQHIVSNFDITLDGDRASARTQLFNPMGARTRTGRPHWFFIGGSYHDELRRTADGWKISKRVEQLTWLQGSLPEELIRE